METEKLAADAGPRRRFEARLRRFDGVYRWFLFRPAPFHDQSGKLVRWYGNEYGYRIPEAGRKRTSTQRDFLAEAQKLSHTGSFGWNVSKGEIFWSEETYRIFGYEPGVDVTMNMVLGRVHPDDRDCVRTYHRARCNPKQPFDFEHRLQMADGSVEDSMLSPTRWLMSQQNLQFAGAVMDVTARKTAERALRTSEARYQNLFQAMAVSFFEVDYTSSRKLLRELRDAGVADFRGYFKDNPAFVRKIMRATRVMDVNDRTVALFGRGRKEELLTSVEPFWPDESISDYVEAVLASIERNEEFSAETRMRKLDGTIFDAHFTLRYASEDKIRGLAGVIDITERRQAEKTMQRSEVRLSEAERELRLMLDSIPTITWRGGSNGYVQYLNKRWFDYTGTTPEQTRGASWKSCIHPEDLEQLVNAGIDYVASGKPIDTEARLRRFDGEYRWFLFRPSPAHDELGNIVGWYGAITDIEERKQAEAALRDSEQRYRNLFHHMPVALWQLDARGIAELFKTLRSEGVEDLDAYFDAHPSLPQRCMEMFTIQEVNQHTVQLLGGRDANEIVGTSIARYFPENSPTFRRSMVSRYRRDPNYGAETKLRTLDGRTVDVLYTASRIGPATEPGVSVLGMIDITERKQAFAELEASEKRYRTLFHYMPIGLTQIDARNLVPLFRELRAQGVTELKDYIDAHPDFLPRAVEALEVEDVNQYNVDLFGAKNADEMHGPITRYWRPGIPTIRRSIEARYRGDQFFQEETKVARMDGSTVDVLFTAARPGAIADKSFSSVSSISLSASGPRTRCDGASRGTAISSAIRPLPYGSSMRSHSLQCSRSSVREVSPTLGRS